MNLWARHVQTATESSAYVAVTGLKASTQVIAIQKNHNGTADIESCIVDASAYRS